MDKLIKLLNEYEKEERNHQTSRTYEYNGFHYIDYGMIYSEFLMLSKKYGFIKWLVDNDKIDGKKFYEKNILKGFITITKEEKADSIIMNLSISDTPIEDLISYLK